MSRRRNEETTMIIRSPVLRGTILGLALALLVPLSLAAVKHVYSNSYVDTIVLEGRIKANLQMIGGWEALPINHMASANSYDQQARKDGLHYSAYFDDDLKFRNFKIGVHDIKDGKLSNLHHKWVVFDGPRIKSIEKTENRKPCFISDQEKELLSTRARELYLAIMEAAHAR